MKLLNCIALFGILLSGPVMAQNIDFGDDSGDWANDGECDDPRFEGPGMTTTPLLDEDIRRDATDCRTAFEAGQLSLRGTSKIFYGNDQSDWANNGECDDRRFIGASMNPIINAEDIARDATDCRQGVEAGILRLWDEGASKAATQCASLDFGDDSGEYANDSICDDGRFEGRGMSPSGVNTTETGHDASDCSLLCNAGMISLRNY